jgi:hypothetical protein
MEDILAKLDEARTRIEDYINEDIDLTTLGTAIELIQEAFDALQNTDFAEEIKNLKFLLTGTEINLKDCREEVRLWQKWSEEKKKKAGEENVG